MIRNVNVAGIQTSTASRDELVYLIAQNIDSYSVGVEPYVIFSSNGQAVALYNTDADTKFAYIKASLVHADGQSIVFFSRLLYKENAIKERSATTDLITDVPKLYDRNLNHFLLGGEIGLADRAASILQACYSNFIVCGTHHGFFDINEPDNIIELINSAKPDILWVGLGKPNEQIFCTKYREKLNVPVIVTCGGCYNFVTGDYLRAPIIMQKLGLEWLHRLIKNPSRLFVRYLITNIQAVYYFIKWGRKIND